MLLLLICFPLAAAAAVWLMGSRVRRAQALPVVGGIHLALVVAALASPAVVKPEAWLRLDPLGGWVLLVVSVVFLVCALYAPAYLALRMERDDRVFCACLLAFLGMASMVACARHPGLLWVGMEAMTLFTTPLLYFNHNKRSLEATWKFLLLCSVGMALALLGTFFMAYAAQLGGAGEPFYFDRLVQKASAMHPAWIRAGFVLLLVGYGTKMGLAPLHAWKPDAYGETPGMVGTILAGGVTSCAFLALARMHALTLAAGQGDFARSLLLAIGLLSMAWALVFMVRQGDVRRLLAYSSVEHMGILAFGLGIGGGAARFALYHLAANALVKGVLFMASGNLIRAYVHRDLPGISGAMRRLPVSGWLFLLGFAAITGAPPFAPFIGMFGISSSAILGGHPWAGAAFLVLLGLIFMAMGAVLLPALQGVPHPRRTRTAYRDTVGTTGPLLGALGLALLLGCWMPGPLETLLCQAAELVEGR